MKFRRTVILGGMLVLLVAAALLGGHIALRLASTRGQLTIQASLTGAPNAATADEQDHSPSVDSAKHDGQPSDSAVAVANLEPTASEAELAEAPLFDPALTTDATNPTVSLGSAADDPFALDVQPMEITEPDVPYIDLTGRSFIWSSGPIDAPFDIVGRHTIINTTGHAALPSGFETPSMTISGIFRCASADPLLCDAGGSAPCVIDGPALLGGQSSACDEPALSCSAECCDGTAEACDESQCCSDADLGCPAELAADDQPDVAATEPAPPSQPEDAPAPALETPSRPDKFPFNDVAVPIFPDALAGDSPIAAPPRDRSMTSEDVARSILDQEFPEARPDEREVWLEELKGLPAEMIRELLQLRRRFSTPIPEHLARAPKPPDAPTLDSSSDDVAPAPPTHVDDDDVQNMLAPTRAALRQARLVILNNIANANTVGFKRSTFVFSDLGYENIRGPGKEDENGHRTPAGVALGSGMQLAATLVDLAQGPLRNTGRELDLAIHGNGFFQVRDGAGRTLYTRAGSLSVGTDGALVLTSADNHRRLEPAITLPTGWRSLHVSPSGVVRVDVPGETPDDEALGQIPLVTFRNPGALEPRGENLFAATAAAGEPQIGPPDTTRWGSLRQGSLEDSNVSVPDELAALQRLQQQLDAVSQAAAIVAPHHPEPQRDIALRPTIRRGRISLHLRPDVQRR